MSRLIDADVLLDNLNTYITNFRDASDKNMLAHAIEAGMTLVLVAVRTAPTININIESPRHSQWSRISEHKWCCTWCGKTVRTEENLRESNQYNFCQGCGAKMF